MVEELFRDLHFVVTQPEPGIVRIDRTEKPFDTIDELETTMRQLTAKLAGLDRASLGVLVDTRAARPRNDPEFEKAFEPHRKRMLAGFGRQAVLVRTEVGRMQVQRHAEQDELSFRGFREESKALAWLRGEAAGAP